MTKTQKSYVQVASNSLTLDDVSALIARAKAGNRTKELLPVSAVPESPSVQQLTATETPIQSQVETPTISPVIEEPVVTVPKQSEVPSVSVPLVRADAPENIIKPTATTTRAQSRLIGSGAPVSFGAALDQLESRPPARTEIQHSAEGERKIFPRRRAESVQQIPFVSPQKSPTLQPAKPLEPLEPLESPEPLKSPKSPKTLSPINDSDLSEFSLSILDNFPLGPSSVLLIADIDGDKSGSEVANLVARELAAKSIGRILLVDSHFEQRALTQDLAPGSELGIADVISMNRGLDQVLCESDKPNLDFLPAGTPIMCRRRDQQHKKVAEITRKLKSDYQFTVISVGSAFEHAAKVWAKHSEATYVTVSMNQSNRTVAQTGVRELQKHGARLMGCVVTDAAA